ncbi:MAG TPA: xanthine dehydrogenase family protein molybdopterin-binding subunit [Candidatus Acidoferrales bacterium]|jgi:xanthine dehydrogenase YagR molybdenum-binding subunit|nr:xanthine dehydrogenase family protein molybdopterin-binding subunit [Candidatus Acidoferrales bacterium]
MADYKWPPVEKRSLIGKRISKLDSPWKSSGTAVYAYDVHRPNMLYGRMVLSPHAHAKITSIDTSEAEKMPGVHAVHIITDSGVGKEALWAGKEIVSVAAETDDQARDAARKVKIEYEVLPYLVADTTPDNAKGFTQQLNEVKQGDPDAGFAQADAVVEGTYGLPTITHCCLESHGSVAEWDGDKLTVWASTQSVSGLTGEYSQTLTANGIPVTAANVRILTPVMGGGFGSKFAADTWGISAAVLAKKAGRPVKMMLDRDQELMVAGMRPSLYAKVKVGAKKDGTLAAWQSESWGTSGPTGGSANLPYVMQVNLPLRRVHTAVHTNVGPARAWRAPNHPQACLVTMSAFEDLAAKLNMDPVQFLLKNMQYAGERNKGFGTKDYEQELAKASELMDWQKKWHPRGDQTPGPIKRGVGVSLHTWGGAANNSSCNITIHPDGSVELNMSTQDLGVGTRTTVGIVAAETLGLPLEAITVNIGDSNLPPAGGSGGSTTIGGVSSATRLAATAALNKLLDVAAASLGVTADQLEAVGGKIQVIGNPAKSITWKQACGKLGATTISETAKTPGANTPERTALVSVNVGGVQMAEVSVDVETGVVRMEKFVAVQDCGLIIDLKTAESQVYGAMIMGVCYALYEEKVMDQQTGMMLNANMEFYKLAGIGDIGELVVYMMQGPGYDDRGVIGLGEPPTVSPGAAISNAVANAIGVRVPMLPLTPDRVLAALGKGGMA